MRSGTAADGTVAATLSNGEIFLWGSLGAILAFLVVFILPEAVKIFKGEQTLDVTLKRGIAALVIFVIFIAAGGLLSIAFGDATEGKQALAYGLGIEGIITGSLKGFTAGS
jgi:hypothetical protein